MATPPQPGRRRVRSWKKRVALALLIVIAASCVWLFVRWPALRQQAGEYAMAQVSALLVGEFHVERVESLSPWNLVLRGVRIEGPDGEPVVRAGRLETAIALSDLIELRVTLTRVRLEDGWVSLRDLPGELAIAETFLPVEDEAAPEDDSPPSALQVWVEDIRVSRVTAVDLPEGYELALSGTRGRVRYGPRGTSVDVEDTRLRARRPGQDVAEGSLAGRLALIEGEESTLSFQVSAGESRVKAHASVPYDGEAFGIPSGELDLVVYPSLPSRLGLDALPVTLQAPVHAQARVDAGAQTAEVDVQTEGGDVELRAEAQGEGYRLEVLTKRLNLQPTLGADAPPVLAGDLSLELTPREGEQHYAYVLQLADGRVDEVRLPRILLTGDADPKSLRVASLRVPQWTRDGDEVRLSGRLTEAGRVRVDLSASLRKPLLSGLVQQLAGVDARSVDVEVHGTYDHDSARVDGRAHVKARGLRGHDVRLDRLVADLSARGSLLRPRLDTTLRAEHLVVPGAEVAAIDARLVGFEEYRGTLAIEGQRGVVQGDVEVQLRAKTASLQGELVTRFRDGREMAIDVGSATYEAGGVTLSRVRLRAEGGYLSVEGRIHPTAQNDVSLAFSGLDLEMLAKLPALEGHLSPYEPRGQVSGNVRLRGTFAQPAVVAELRGDGMGVAGAVLGSLRVELDYANRENRVRLVAKVDPPKIDRLELTLTGELPPRPRLDASLLQGRYRLEIDGIVTDVGTYAALHPELAKVKGGIDLEGQVEGSDGEGITGELVLGTTGAAYAGFGPANLRADLQLERQATELAVTLTDDAGALVTASAAVQSGVLAFVREGVPDAAWSVKVQVPRRRLDEFPEPLTVDVPLRLAAKLEASGQALELSQLDLNADATWAGQPAPGAPAECLGRDRIFSLQAKLAHGKLDLDGRLRIDGEEMLSVRGTGSLPDVPLDSLQVEDARAQLSVRSERLELSGLPYLCGRVRGTLEADLEGEGLFAGRPDLQAKVRITGLGGYDAPTLDLALSGSAKADGLRAELRALDGERRVLQARASLPWKWRGLAAPTEVAQVPEGEVKLEGLPLETLTKPFDQYVRMRGQVSGKLATKPGAVELVPVGKLELDGVHLALSDPALRLEDIRGTLEVDERRLRFTDLRWGDREGTLRTSGEVQLDGLKPRKAEIRVQAEDLPVRSGGLAFATVDTRLKVDADFEPQPAVVNVGIEHLSVELSDELNRSSQELDQHPHVIYVDSFDEEVEDEPDEPVEEKPAFVARIHIDTPKPFWVRHLDFAVQIQPQLQITTSEQGARIAGPVYVRRGYVNLVGRTFNFERGEIRFSGGEDLDPTVDIVAKHFLNGGEYVQVRIGGYLSRPELEFSTNVAGVGNNETEIMALLVRGKPGDGSASATAEAAAMLSGLTAGFLSSLTRGKYGEYVPVLALEAGSSTGARLRAGVQMDDFVPKALRGVVQGAYVEGYVGAGGTDDQTGQQTSSGGFLIELYMPHDITTSGAYDEPTNWSVDLLWEPLR